MATAKDTPFLDFFGLTPKSTQALQQNRRDEVRADRASSQQGLLTEAAAAARLGGQPTGVVKSELLDQDLMRGGLLNENFGKSQPIEQQTKPQQAATIADLGQGGFGGNAAQLLQQLGPTGQNAMAADRAKAQFDMGLAQIQADRAAEDQFQLDSRGGLSKTEHLARSDKFDIFNRSANNTQDLINLNSEFGREVWPSTAKALYDSFIFNEIDAIRNRTEAGALQQAEIEFFKKQIPEFGVWNQLSSEAREAKLRELQRQHRLSAKQLSDSTAGLDLPEIQGRTVGQMLNGVDNPPGTIPVDSNAMERFLSSPGFAPIARGAKGLLGVVEGFGQGAKDFIDENRNENARR